MGMPLKRKGQIHTQMKTDEASKISEQDYLASPIKALPETLL